nr:MAG TPA: hypothetical protein [Caudoviricetes sp.]
MVDLDYFLNFAAQSFIKVVIKLVVYIKVKRNYARNKSNHRNGQGRFAACHHWSHKTAYT